MPATRWPTAWRCTPARHRRGYGWIFPVAQDASTVCFNIGVGLWKADQREGATVSDYLEHFLAHDALASSLGRGRCTPRGAWATR
jgi:flavin-dependent dehydrogenase